jgi:phage-related protein
VGDEDPKRLPAAFWKSETGTEPVRDWLKSLEQEDRYEIGTDIKTLEYGWPVGMPVCGSLGRGLWEVRTSLPHGRIARVIFCLHENEMILLHGFIKKTQKTPPHDLELAHDRKKKLKSDKELESVQGRMTKRPKSRGTR